MNKKDIEDKIKALKKFKVDNFLTITDQTYGFYNGRIAVYEEWLLHLKQ